jgi:CheY-like chemotaxis protein
MQEGKAMSARRVLVIDDDEEVRTVICENLADCGYAVTRASDGEEGLAMAADGAAPDLIITDIIMPRKNGIEVIEEVRRAHPATRVIAISGGARDRMDDPLAEAQAAGCHAVMRKPLDLAELERLIRWLMTQT